MLALRIEQKLRIKGSNAVNLGNRNIEPECDITLNFEREISVDILRSLHYGHERPLFAAKFLDNGVKLLLLLLGPVERDRRHFLFHLEILPPESFNILDTLQYTNRTNRHQPSFSIILSQAESR